MARLSRSRSAAANHFDRHLQVCSHAYVKRNNPMQNCSLAVIFSLIAIIVLTVQSSSAAEGEWSFNIVDSCYDAVDYFNSSIHLDSKERPQVVFQRDANRGSGLSYARREGDTWKTQAIEDDGSVFSIHFALDGSDVPHILYSIFNCPAEGLKYAAADGMKWEKATIYSKPSPPKEDMLKRFGCDSYSLGLMVSDSNDLATDKNGGVHIVYADPESEKVVYGYRPKGAKNWTLESLEKVGNHKLTCSRIMPLVRVSPTGEIWVIYKRYTEEKTTNGVRTVRIELRLAVKVGSEWKYSTITDKLGFIDGASKVFFGKAGECLVAYSVCCQSRFNDPATTWVLVQLKNGQWVERYEGESREQLLTAAWLGEHFNILVTRVRPDRPADGTVLQDKLVCLGASADWKWKAKDLLQLKNRRVLAVDLSQTGDVYALFFSSGSPSTLECGILKAWADWLKSN